MNNKTLVPITRERSKSKITQPNILLANCQSLTSKKSDELLTICASDDISVILATETWFKDTKQIQLSNYKLFTTHRANRFGGGTAVYTQQDLPVKQLNKYTYNDDKTSATWVKMTTTSAAPDVIYGCIYHPPDAVEETTRSEEHTSELQSPCNLVCRLLLEKKKTNNKGTHTVNNHERDRPYNHNTGVL